MKAVGAFVVPVVVYQGGIHAHVASHPLLHLAGVAIHEDAFFCVPDVQHLVNQDAAIVGYGKIPTFHELQQILHRVATVIDDGTQTGQESLHPLGRTRGNSPVELGFDLLHAGYHLVVDHRNDGVGVFIGAVGFNGFPGVFHHVALSQDPRFMELGRSHRNRMFQDLRDSLSSGGCFVGGNPSEVHGGNRRFWSLFLLAEQALELVLGNAEQLDCAIGGFFKLGVTARGSDVIHVDVRVSLCHQRRYCCGKDGTDTWIALGDGDRFPVLLVENEMLRINNGSNDAKGIRLHE